MYQHKDDCIIQRDQLALNKMKTKAVVVKIETLDSFFAVYSIAGHHLIIIML